MGQSRERRAYADASVLDLAMAEFVESAARGDVVWLTRDGERVGAVAPLDVVEAGLRALGREVSG
ncbi:hypothetical protein [Pseudonocardia acidicola]|uniref:Prevent-host-death family protein n=1 Tax=Pseudonocardia acidicola TaxID=2724939 RepID=A0ABX1S902_9PSEU|nr:hypothetical protein [Pseudonocardia acidicola]NMH98035.1 hypothetical protein [Pseudonocardia acidicola]